MRDTPPTFGIPGKLHPAIGTVRYYVGRRAVIEGAEASVGAAPKGSALVVDVRANNRSICRPQILPGDVQATAAADHAVGPGDYLTVDIDHVGSKDPGRNLVVQIQLGRLSLWQWARKRLTQVFR